MDALNVMNLSKSFKNKKVLNNVSFSVPQGKIIGFVGENGAGKTTTMKCIVNFLKPNSGIIEICGNRIEYGREKYLSLIGYLQDVPNFYGYMTAKQYLKFSGELVGIPRRELDNRVCELLEMVGLKDSKITVNNYSRGMKQRLGVAQAIINKPKLLICDEPTSALDPSGRKEILDLLKTVSQSTSILFSTHILSDVEKTCDGIVILNNGTSCFEGPVNQLKEKYITEQYEIEFTNSKDLEKFVQVTNNDNGKGINEEKNIIRLDANDKLQTQEEILHILYKNQILFKRIEIVEPDLESIFFEVTRK